MADQKQWIAGCKVAIKKDLEPTSVLKKMWIYTK